MNVPQRAVHVCRIFSSPWPEVFGTDTESDRRYDRHWHTTFGFGLMERGAHRSMSGRGMVDAHVGQLITTNPGEVHDGWPLGASTRRWRMVYLDAAVLSTIVDCTRPAVDVRLTQPVIDDEALIPEVRLLLWHLERWGSSSQPSGSQLLSAAAPLRAGIRNDALPVAATVRVERARVLIARQSPLAQVAADCGFADQTHMTRAFTDHFGFTPGAWAATHRPARIALYSRMCFASARTWGAKLYRATRVLC